MPRIAYYLMMLLAVGCSGPPAHVFRCAGGEELTARYLGDTLRLDTPTGAVALPRAPAASGARYADDTLEFWEHAGAARVTRRGQVLYEDCRPPTAAGDSARVP
jgi:membrane-bound inhibitor of C-type lysozyme